MALKQRYICFIYAILLNILFNNLVTAQSFEHIELASGLSVLEENNGVAVADIDGDFDLDIFVVAKGKEKAGSKKTYSRLFRNNNNGTFTDITAQSGLVNLFTNDETSDRYNGLDGSKYGAFWGDYDNDGFPDIFFTHSLKVQLFHNQGNGTFVEVTETAGIESYNNCKNTGATWFDYNNDGFLDLFIMGWTSTACDNNLLYKNNGDGTFLNIPFESPSNEANFAMLPFDFNNDGWKDLYVPEDLFEENDLYINQNGINFVEQASDYGLNSSIDDMGITMGDFNLDGYFDIFITGINQNVLYENDGTNHFSEVSAKNNIPGTGWAWGTKFADFDLDGDEDLFIVNGFISSKPQSQHNVYYKNLYKEGENVFEDASDEVNLGSNLTMSTEVVDFDYDNDGDLDLFVTNADKASYFYKNRIINANEESTLNWFKVSLQGTTSNRDAFGTTVTIKTSNGTNIRYYSGVGFLSQSLKPVHFGLNKADKIDELKILWTSGLIEIYHNITSNVFIKATEGQGYKIIDTEQSREVIYGCTDPKSCTYNPLATVNDYSCEYIATSKIIGKTNTGLNRTEDYTYRLNPGSQAIWTIEGGKIISGQGTNTISVKWGLEKSGRITVKEKRGTCISSLSELNIDLNINRISDNVSIARIWNEALLEAIRKDFARPTVHSRNLFHTSVALYDVWAIYDEEARPYLIGNTVNNFKSNLEKFIPLESIEESINKAMSYAVYRLLTHRFQKSPGSEKSLAQFDLIMNQLGYEISNRSVIYQSGDAAALGNYIGQTLINYGYSDKSRESSGYDNAFYKPVNPPLNLNLPEESIAILNPNHWQPLAFDTYIDQSGNEIDGKTPDFLSPEWGNVFPFALSDDDKQIFQKDGNDYVTYHVPRTPPQLSTTNKTNSDDLYKWNFSLVSLWSSHLDPKDGVMWDISPKSIGNIDINSIPNSFSKYSEFYKKSGGDIGIGHTKNPITGQPYKTQMIPRGDYTRALAEFWADGPDSETPPGHWFTILNYVNDHPLFIKKFRGQGKVLDPLEWDVKAYFILSGAMHDSAITAWGIKGWFDYIRPISAIRYMSELGQSTNPNSVNYHQGGITLIPEFIEIIEEGDSLSGLSNENVGKIKVYAWKGHDFINNPKTDVAGVGWILSKNWWPYQRLSFVTPPFAGYISGHSTFSRAAAEVMTLITGDEFFPGGIGEFVAKKDEFLVFEKGPSVDVVLQWATYRDASDQTSLSRIWGGIHPPADDLPGRLIGEKIGKDAFYFALPYFKIAEQPKINKDFLIYPNPTVSKEVYITNTKASDTFNLFDIHGRSIPIVENKFDKFKSSTLLKFLESTAFGLYILKVNDSSELLIINK